MSRAAPAAHLLWGALTIAVGVRLLVGGALLVAEWRSPTPPHPNPRIYHGVAPRTDLLGQLSAKWDSYWYLDLAASGYQPATPRMRQSNAAFAPLYPWLVSLLSRTGIDPVLAGVALSLVAQLAFYVFAFELGASWHSPRLGMWLVLFLSAFPSAWVLQMVYSEALFCALVAAMLLLHRRHRFGPAALCAGLLPLTRTAGLVAIPALAAEIGLRRLRGSPARGSWLVLGGAVAGLAALMAVQAAALGDPLAFARAGRAWYRMQGVEGALVPLLSATLLRIQEQPANLVFPCTLALYAAAAVRRGLEHRDLATCFVLLYLLMLLSTPIVSAQLRYLLPLVPIHAYLIARWLDRPRLLAVGCAVLVLLQIALTRLELQWRVVI